MTGQDPLTITKKELVHRIADATGQTKVVVKDVVQRFLDEIVGELVAGNRLEFREFGVFEIRQRASRVAQNPRTLEKVEVPAKRVVKFKAGRLMRQQIGGDDSDDGAEDFEDDEDERPTRASAPRRTSERPAARAKAPAANAGTSPQPPEPPPAPLRPPPKPPSNSPF